MRRSEKRRPLSSQMEAAKLKYLAAFAVTITIIATICHIYKNRNRRKRYIWVKPWLNRRHTGRGLLYMVSNELRLEDKEAYRNFLRMNDAQFTDLLKMVESDIKKNDTNMRESVAPEKRLAATLRFLATGESYRSLVYSTRIHESTLSIFIPEVCRAIYNNLKDKYLKMPNTTEEWQKITQEFYNIWNFPNLIGALDGKHISFRPPTSAGSYYYNYKGGHSIVLLALVDANYRFLYIDVGVNGRVSDGGVFRESSLCYALNNNALNLSAPTPLPGRNKPIPYVIVADDAFPLKTYIMKPFPQRGLSHDKRLYNQRLSRARRVVENGFGHLANRFRIFLAPINLSPDKVEIIVLACCALHNYLNKGYEAMGDDAEVRAMHSTFDNVGQQCGNKSSISAQNIREEFKSYFNSEGFLQWQNNPEYF